MAVTTQFLVSEKRPTQDTEGGQVFLRPVYGDSDEDKARSEWTPAEQMEMSITVQEVFDAFELGATYSLTFDGDMADLQGIHIATD